MDLTIPWPSGIMVDKAYGHSIIPEGLNGTEQREVFRVGRNQHNYCNLIQINKMYYRFRGVRIINDCLLVPSEGKRVVTKG